MALSIQTNYANLVGQNTINKTNSDFNTSIERLTTGFRINSAADDAAGLQISNRLEAQGRGMGVAMRNAGDAISQMQTAEGAMEQMTDIAYRMNDLATQAANGTASADDRAAMQSEFSALADELGSLMDNTNMGGQKLLDATDGVFTDSIDYQVGSTADEKLSVDISTELTALQTGVTNLQSADISTDAAAALTQMTALSDSSGGTTSFIDEIGAARSSLGANINRLDYTVSNLASMQENTEAAKSNIMDTDMASESSAMSKNQMLMQMGTQMLSTTKMVPQLAMGLLG